jgi:hypothetical protein
MSMNLHYYLLWSSTIHNEVSTPYSLIKSDYKNKYCTSLCTSTVYKYLFVSCRCHLTVFTQTKFYDLCINCFYPFGLPIECASSPARGHLSSPQLEAGQAR